jgi:PAS domain S-box-containing protein
VQAESARDVRRLPAKRLPYSNEDYPVEPRPKQSITNPMELEEEMREPQMRVLLVESDETQREAVARLLRSGNGYIVETAADQSHAQHMLAGPNRPYEVVLINEWLASKPGTEPEPIGLDLKHNTEAAFPDTEVAIYTGCGVDRGCDSLRAADLRCLGRSFNSDQLALMVHQAAEKQRLRAALRQNEALGRLLESGTALLGGYTEDQVLEFILHDIQAIGFDRVRLYLLSEDGRHLVGRAHAGMDQGFLAETWLVADDEYMQLLIKTHRPHVFKREPGKPKHTETALAKEGVDEWACLPLILRGRVIGSLAADNKHTRRPIKEEELVPIALFTSLATAAIENAKLLRDARRRAAQLELLRNTTLAISQYLDRRTLLETIIRQAVSLLDASSGSIFQFHPDRGELTIAANYRRPEETNIVLKVGEGMAGRLVVSGLQYMIVDDYDNWEGRAAVYEGKRRFEAVVQVPLMSDQEVIGVLSVDAELPRCFTEEDAGLLGQFADHAAITLSSAELAEKEANKARRLQALSQISSEIVGDLGSMTLEQRLDLIARRAAEVLEAEACGISLVKRPGFLRWEASFGYPQGIFTWGREFAVVSEPKGGLSGHIAKEGRMFNAWGAELTNHWAVKAEEKDRLAIQNCHSLLALPLKNRHDQLIGLLRVENKLGSSGKPDQGSHFTADDELILNCFGQAVVVAIEAGVLIEQLYEKNDLLERLADSSPNGIISTNLEGNVTGFNERAQEIMGYTRGEVLGRPVSRLYYPADEPRKIGKLLHLNEEGKLAERYGTHVQAKDGTAVPILLSATWLYDSRKNRIGSVGYFEDLRSRKAYERRQELLLKASNTLAHAEDLAAGLKSLAELMVIHLRHTLCRILLLDESTLFLATEAAYPQSLQGEPIWNTRRRDLMPLAEWLGLHEALKAGKPLILRYSDARFSPILDRLSRQLGLSRKISSLLFIPLKIRDRVVGLIEMAELRTEEVSTFTEDERELAAAIASQTTMLIERMRLLEEARRSHEKVRELFEASNALISDRVDAVLREIVERTRAASAAGLVRIILIDETGKPRIQAQAGSQFRQFNLTEALRATGRTMEAMRTGETIWIPDVDRTEQDYVNSQYKEAGIRAAVCLPLLLRGTPIGVMWISYDEARHFSPGEKQALQLYVNQAALACGSARRIEALTRMHHAAAQMSRSSDLEQSLKTIVIQAKSVFLSYSAALASYDSLLGEFITDQFVSEGIPDAMMQQFRDTDPEKGGITHTVLKHKYLAVPDVDKETREFMKPDGRQRLADASIASFHGVALDDGGECLGVLYVSYNQPRPFTAEDRRGLQDFATYAALSLKKARLLDRLSKTKKAAQVVARVAAMGGIDAALPTLTERIRSGLRADAATLWVCDPITGKFNHPPGAAGLEHPEHLSSYGSVVPGSILATLLARDERYVAETIKGDPILEHSPFARIERIQSCCVVPLKAAGRKVGLMVVNYRTRHRFSGEELKDIELFADQAAVSIANTQLFEELKAEVAEQNAHLKLSERLIGCSSLREILDHAVAVAVEVLQTDFCNIILPDKEGNLILSAAVGWPEELIGKLQLEPGTRSQAGYTIEIEGPVTSPDYSKEERFTLPKVAIDAGVKSGLTVPMFRGEKVIGAMVVQTKYLRQFSSADIAFLSLIANQTAVAIEKVEHFEAARKRSSEIEALYEASRAISSASRGLHRKQILDRILEQAVRSVERQEGTRVVFGSLQVFDSRANELVFESVHPHHESSELVQRLGERRGLYRKHQPSWKIGVTGRTVIERRPLLIADVTRDRDYLEFNSSTKSELTVPLVDQESEHVFGRHPVLGVLNLESSEPAAFGDDDVKTLQALAELAVIVIKNAEQYETLDNTKTKLAAKTAVAMMGIASSVWWHNVRADVIIIRDNTQRIARDLTDFGMIDTFKQATDRIVRACEAIIAKPVFPSVDSIERVEPCAVNDLIQERANGVWKDSRYEAVEITTDLELREPLRVLIHKEYLRHVTDLLVDNAVKALENCVTKQITVSARQRGPRAEIKITDTANGIPPEISHLVFNHPIPKHDGKRGFGMGLLLAQTIIQAHGGNINVESTGPGGTTMTIELPLEG